MKQWYAVRSKPRQEQSAELNLQRQDFDVYLPRIRLRKQSRGKKQGLWTTVIEPLFPSYLFIRFDPAVDNTAPVRSTRGVLGLVRIGMNLQPVPTELIEYLKAAEDPQENIRADDEWPHQPGDAVEILQGPLMGLKGVYQMQIAESRALVLVELLGRYNEVQLELQQIAGAV